ASPSLTWRDVQYLIVYTANPRKTPAPRTLNRTGLTVSRQYGFGVLDIEALVTRARHWINVPPQIEDKITDIAQQQILDNISYSGTVTYNGPIQYLEHVVVRISVAVLEDFKRGDLQIELTSPSGTLSILLMPRPNDALPSQSGYSDWPFMSVMFWGENPTGQWTLNIKTGDVSSGANVTNVVFQFYGVFQVPEAVANIPDQCHSDCRRGCAREGSNFCDSCVNLRNAYTLECINECPPGYTERNRYCYDASLPLKECNSPLKSKEGTRFTPGYEPIGCQEGGIDTCCADTDKDCNLFYPDHQCFCDDVCHNFDDCCGDVDQIGCTEQNVTHFPYIELGVTPGIETQHAVEKPMDVDFPYYLSLEETVSVGPDGYFNFGTDLSSLVGPFSSTGSIPGSASYEVHRGALSQNVLSQASSIVNANEATNFYAKWVLLATWETYAENNKTNTFQGMLATDFISSYTVFTYNCRDMSFSPPIGTSIIGFYHNDFPSLEINHGATRREKPHLIACINQPSSPWVNVVYGLSADDSLVDECEMDNGGCEQICTDTFLSFGCSCTYGYVLNSDGVSCSEEPVELEFTGDTPMVTGSNISVMIHVSPARPLRCQLITRGASGMPIRTAEDKCSSGEVVFQNVPAGEHRVRVIAGNGDAVIRSFIVLMPDSPHFCSLNAINRGITKHHYNGTVSSYTIEWRAIGDSVGFLCDFGIPEYAEKCSSPYTFSAEDGVTRVKVLPDPEKCRGMRSPFVFRLD
ncbi:Furin-like protease 2, partial [Geodia barretti]